MLTEANKRNKACKKCGIGASKKINGILRRMAMMEQYVDGDKTIKRPKPCEQIETCSQRPEVKK